MAYIEQELKSKLIITEEDSYKLGYERGRQFVRENKEKLPEEFTIVGVAYNKGFMTAIQDELSTQNEVEEQPKTR
jgi:hypothetical protein